MKSDYCSNNIYHYTTIDTLNNYILKNNELRASQLLNTNDPKEYKRKIFGIGFSSGEEEKIDPYVSDNIINKYINTFKIISFCCDDSYRNGYLKPRMWAQYGENNEGCCIEFDKRQLLELINVEYIFTENSVNLIKQNKYFKYENIAYIDTNKNVENQNVINSKIDVNAKEESIIIQIIPSVLKTFFEKDIDWQSENEFRILLKSKEENYEYINFKKSLKKIYLGEKVRENTILKLIQICSENDIELYKLVWDRNKYVKRKMTKNYIFKRKIETEIFKKNVKDIEQYIKKNFEPKYFLTYMNIIYNQEDKESSESLMDLLKLLQKKNEENTII